MSSSIDSSLSSWSRSTPRASRTDSERARSFFIRLFSARACASAASAAASGARRCEVSLPNRSYSSSSVDSGSSAHVAFHAGSAGDPTGTDPPKRGMTGASVSSSPPSSSFMRVLSAAEPADASRRAAGSQFVGGRVFGGRTARLADAELDLDLRLDVGCDVRVLEQEVAGVLLALTELLAVVGVPRAGLLDDAVLDAEVDETALARDADAVQDVELRLLERRCHLVLDDLDAGAVSDCLGAVLERLDAADVEAHRRVELQRLAAGGGLGRAEEHADLLAQLVDEDHR